MVTKEEFYGYEKYTISSSELSISVITLGAIITAIDFGGKNLTLFHDTAEEYLTKTGHVGGLIGRYANRIANSRFVLNGKEYLLPPNEKVTTHLHGGPGSFDARRWNAEVLDNAVRFTLHSPDGDNGYPGNLDASATYSVSGNSFRIDFEGVSDQDTIYNPTTHLYLNLGDESCLDTRLQLNADYYLAVDDKAIPTAIMPVSGKFDLNTLHPIRENIDHCFISKDGTAVAESDTVRLELTTDYPAIQLYTGIFLGYEYKPNDGFCLEPEFYPDSPNHPEYPSPVLRAGDKFHKYVEYVFTKK